LSEIPPGCPLTCPGCNETMTMAGTAGAWFDNTGRFRGTYVLCPRCSTIAQHGTKAERESMSERIEHTLILAESPPSRGVN
jgi:hypothetical protein